jgi:enamine deaminase RidA (YjgF/YER057c/UK114 family)
MSFAIVNPPALGRPSGWNNGLLAPAGGRLLFVAGQAAADATGAVPPASFTDQWDRALARVVEVVRAAGGAPEHIARLTVYVTDRAAYLASRKPLGEIHRRHLGRHYPAMALVAVQALVDPNALLEMEATAVLP